MAAPLAKGLIITASVLVAAGIAVYESEQVREWILQYRQRLAMALHSLGDDISPSSRDMEDDEASVEARRNRRLEVIRMNRLDLIRRAREEGIAVDLDELTAMGEREEAVANARGFDDFVSQDGTLRSVQPRPEMSQATGAESNTTEGLRHRGASVRGLESGMRASPWANPFDDDAQVLFDRALIGTDEETEALLQSSRESSRTLSPAPLVDTSDTASEYLSEAELEAQIEEAIRRSLTDVTTEATQEKIAPSDPPTSIPESDDTVASEHSEDDLYYYAPPPNVSQPPASHQVMFSAAMADMLQANLQNPTPNITERDSEDGFVEDDEIHTPTGMMTPTDDGYSAAASMASNDVAAMSDFQSEAGDETPASFFGNAPVQVEHEEVMSDFGSDDSFSVVGAGTSTPGSAWSDVGSEAGEEEGHQGQVQYQNMHIGQ
ncbi:hypothetical protein BLS_003911 [Venturia inaequalis]|uniref:Uncharacterized protein n=1 Tax=Venturia inaequalis TaxID=5025 RepID=A0A8H3UP72_VENIN|nr:hypothetical protein BLS_003911 [Venturia inaequalis]KAE9981956.1 hypothetical protein EG328_011305 [Venturia inaequalis]KAE9993830.1 hypothetical protein EG327_003080 [Venturia inaequalis]